MIGNVIHKLQVCAFAHPEAVVEQRGDRSLNDRKAAKASKASGSNGKKSTLKHLLSLAAGPLVFAAVMCLPGSGEFTYPMKALAASTLWIAIWWITEAINISATSLLPLVLFPACGVSSFAKTAAGYADSVVFLFMGGFMLAATMQRWNLHQRLALNIVKYVGTNPSRLILGFIVATGFLSMWISNTATAVMMMPVGLAVITQLSGQASAPASGGADKNRLGFGTALMLGIAYAASIGGVATLIGSPPNAIFASMAGALYGTEITFVQWFLWGFPIAIIFLILTWLYLVKKTSLGSSGQFAGVKDIIQKELQSLGPMGKEEKLTAAVFLFTALAWIFRSLFLQKLMPFLSDAMIAVVAIMLLFTIPVNITKGEYLLDWKTAVKIPWGILLLFGGGIAIANGFSETGLAEWLGNNLSVLQGAPLIVALFAVATLLILLSNVASNTGTISMMLPVIAAMAAAMSVHPFGLMIAATTAVSFVFMLPVGTPPNAVVFGSGHVTIPQMARTGLILTIISIILIPLIVYFWIPLTWGINLGSF